MKISRRVLFATILFLGAAGLATPSLAADCAGQRPWINEFDYDDVSAGGVQDTDEFVEIAAPAGTDLSGYRIMAIEGNADFGACTTGIGGSNGNPYFIGTIPAGTVVGDDTGSGIGFYVVCFTNTSGDIGADCDITVTGVATDSNLKNGDLMNADPTLCPDGVLLLDAQGGLADAISWEGIIPDEGFYGRMFNAPNPSYNAGRDIGYTEAESFEKTTGVGRAVDSWEWSLSGLDSHSPGAINAGQELLCDPPPPEPVDCTVEGPWINEFDYDDNSAGGVQDTDEFVEIAAPAGTDISGYQVLAIEGNQNLIGCGTGQWWIPNGNPYFTGVVPDGTVIADDTGTGIGFYVVCFTYTSGDIGANCDVTVTGIATDSNLKNGNLYNSVPDNCPDGVLLLDPQDDLTDAISWEGIIPSVGSYGHMFNPPNPSYNIGRDDGYTEQESFEKTTGIGRAVEPWEWTFSGANSNSPGAANPGQFLVCAPEDICGDSILTENEDCDDGNTDDGDCCSSTCQFEIVGTECSDGDVCNGLETCDGNGSCDAGTPLACDDADACNGSETCDAALGCQAGTPPVCDDADVCNGVETCDPALGCQAGGPLACDDSNFCNGSETCDAVLGCQAGTPPVCSDGNVCNGYDYCHSILGCQSTPPLSCDDADVCNGSETCDPVLGCQDGAPLACDDADACNGAETCDAAFGCQSGTPLACDDADVCNGAETCDSALGCQAGTPLACDDADACNGLETCDAALGCQAGTPLACDDADVCNGSETCDAVLGCQNGTPLACDDADVCNGSETCDAALGCQAGTPLVCDDGAYCNGSETCDAALGCQNGTAVNPDDGVACTADSCDEVGDIVVNAPDDLACDDADPCTADSCDALTGCGHAAIQGCFAGAVPAAPGWGLPLLAGLLLGAGVLAMRLRRRQAA